MVGQYQFLEKIATHFPYFHLLTSPSQIKSFIYSQKLSAFIQKQCSEKVPPYRFQRVLNNTNSYFDEYYTPTVNTSSTSIDLMQNRNPFFNNSLLRHSIKLWKIKIFRTGFRKLWIFSKFWEWSIWQREGESSCLRHYDALRTKIDMFLS